MAQVTKNVTRIHLAVSNSELSNLLEAKAKQMGFIPQEFVVARMEAIDQGEGNYELVFEEVN